MCRKQFPILALLAIATSFAATSFAADYPAVVPVGDAGNKADTSGYGSVGYSYQIGKYEVTNDEYCAFLNAVAKSDPHELYDGRMDGGPEDWGGISRTGGSGSFSYAARSGMGKKPVGWVTVQSGMRYANWLTNGQGKGDTEDGAYTIKGASAKSPDHAALAKEKTAKWALPSENEWYKAAYFDAKKKGGPGYWQFPGKSDLPPEANINTNAPSDAGHYKNSASPYGTFDQGGNAWEYSDSQTSDGKFGLRGGSFHLNDTTDYMNAFTRYDVYSAKWGNYGFRVVKLGGEETPNK